MTFLEFSLQASLVIITSSIILMIFRLIIGPSLEDRILSLDLITTTGIALIAVYSMISRKTTILDIGVIIGLIAFLGTIAFAYYLERRTLK